MPQAEGEDPWEQTPGNPLNKSGSLSPLSPRRAGGDVT